MFGYQTKTIAGLFALLLFGNLLLAAAVQSMAFEGEFIPEAAWNTFVGFFGGFGPLIAIIVTLAILGLVVFGTAHISRRGHHLTVGILMLLALLLGGAILWRWMDWNALVSAFSVPTLWLLLFTLIETALVLALMKGVTLRRRTTTTTTTPTTA